MEVFSPLLAALVDTVGGFLLFFNSSYAEAKAWCLVSSERTLISRDSLCDFLRFWRGCSWLRASDRLLRPLIFLTNLIALFWSNSILFMLFLSGGSQRRMSPYSSIGLQRLVYARSLPFYGVPCRVNLIHPSTFDASLIFSAICCLSTNLRLDCICIIN